MNSDRSGSANDAFMARIMQGGDTTRVQATLTLADGTKCTDVYRCMTGGSAEIANLRRALRLTEAKLGPR